MPINQDEQSQSTGTNQDGPSQNQPNVPSWSIYRHIIDCPLREFIKFTVDGNLFALVISGKPTDEVLHEAGQNLIMEFDDRMGDSETRMYLDLLKEVTLLNLDYEMVNDVIMPLLTKIHIQQFADELNEIIKHNPPFAFDPNDPKQYKKDLARCVNRSKSILIKHQLKKAQLEKMTNKSKEGEKATKEHYYSVLLVLTRHLKFHVTDNISVFEYIESVKEMNAHYKAMQEANAKH